MSREGLERLRQQIDAAREAIESGRQLDAYRANQTFHEALVALAGNRQLLHFYSSPRAYLLGIAYRSNDPAAGFRLITEHEDITDALARGETELARERIAAHWEAYRQMGHSAVGQFEERVINDRGLPVWKALTVVT